VQRRDAAERIDAKAVGAERLERLDRRVEACIAGIVSRTSAAAVFA
jgi:hypothetical protein